MSAEIPIGTDWSRAGEAATGPAVLQALLSGRGRPPRAFAAGGEVEEEHGPPPSDGGILSTAGVGSLFPFLQWHSWYNIYRDTRDQVLAAGGVDAAMSALAGAVAGPVGAAGAAAASALTGMAGTVVEQFSTHAESLRRIAPLPMAAQPKMRTPEGRLRTGPDIDRSTTINVVKSEGYGALPRTDPLQSRALTYLSHLR
ncbi:hypothetical protein [Nocardia shimofusensis]|uniref:hypothetical protein n=1 Tax=Nocardia shimofusensis TaxID=228596 RepID=UPI0012EDF663|nr:hypothetical protein [Nocardia shimofusensis]